CDVFIVENLRSARRFLKKAGLQKKIDDLQFFEINKRTKAEDIPSFLSPASEGRNIGILSEAGCPGVADPGAEVVKWAHKKNIEVIPLIGPSSILLALMASGMNGQNFAFTGYLPKEKADRRRKIKQLEQFSKTQKQSQIFIETPFRNNFLLDDLRSYCDKETQIVVACDITLPTQYIRRLSAKEWKKEKVDLHKRPCIFILHKY
ncbi:MAG: SAM-dependent methyltransferase, partial [Flavobacteriales bacterium]|nr:SAM-dependent methyltransferase [Flavobacteriales bacterium]